MIEHDRLIDYKGPFPFLWVLSTIPPNYLNGVILPLDFILWCTKWSGQYVFLSPQLFNVIITQGTRKISNADLKKALLDHLSKSSTGLPSPPIPHQQP